MANEIYLLTHDGLSGMISARAASRVLEGALRSEGQSADTVSSHDMRKILMGPVLKELKGILPRAGIERSLKQLVNQLQKESSADQASADPKINGHAEHSVFEEPTTVTSTSSPSQEAEHVQTEAEEQGSESSEEQGSESSEELKGSESSEAEDISSSEDKEVELQDMSEIEVEPNKVDSSETLEISEESNEEPSKVEIHLEAPEENISLDAASDESATKDDAKATEASEETPVLPQRTFEESDLEDIVLTFAQIDHVKTVAAIRNNGEVLISRGSGFDLEALSRLGSTGLMLLSRKGQLRSYYLSHTLGQLFLFPLDNHTLVIIGNADLNLGLVFATLTKLKEEV